MLTEIKQTAKGLRILIEWFGMDMQPVDKSLAEARAKVCPTCPRNVKHSWFARLKKEAADKIAEHISVKTAARLKVENEDELGFCDQCGCCLSLKVWTPLQHILHHTGPEELDRYPDHCWIKKESHELQQPH